MKNNTTSFTMLYSHDNENDTKLMFTKTADMAEIELAFTSEDEDYGTEILVYGGGPTETFMSLCKKQLNELTAFLDASRGGTWRLDEIMESYKHFDGLNNSSLIAFERMLQEIVGVNVCRKLTAGINKNGHEFKIATINEIAPMIRERFIAGDVKAVYIVTEPAEGVNCADDDEAFWSKIVRLDLPFDNDNREIALLMGRRGGGNVTFAYKHYEDDDGWLDDQIIDMICNSTGDSSSAVICAEFIGVNDKDS